MRELATSELDVPWKVLAAAQLAHTSGVGVIGSHPLSVALRKAAKAHVLVVGASHARADRHSRQVERHGVSSIGLAHKALVYAHRVSLL